MEIPKKPNETVEDVQKKNKVYYFFSYSQLILTGILIKLKVSIQLCFELTIISSKLPPKSPIGGLEVPLWGI